MEINKILIDIVKSKGKFYFFITDNNSTVGKLRNLFLSLDSYSNIHESRGGTYFTMLKWLETVSIEDLNKKFTYHELVELIERTNKYE